MTSYSSTRDRLLCPSCRYDVAQTLADGFDRCPECGGEVHEGICRFTLQWLPGRLRNSFYNGLIAAFILPPLMTVVLNVFEDRITPLWAGLVFVVVVLNIGWCVMSGVLIERWLSFGERERSGLTFRTLSQGLCLGLAGWFYCALIGGVIAMLIAAVFQQFMR